MAPGPPSAVYPVKKSTTWQEIRSRNRRSSCSAPGTNSQTPSPLLSSIASTSRGCGLARHHLLAAPLALLALAGPASSVPALPYLAHEVAMARGPRSRARPPVQPTLPPWPVPLCPKPVQQPLPQPPQLQPPPSPPSEAGLSSEPWAPNASSIVSPFAMAKSVECSCGDPQPRQHQHWPVASSRHPLQHRRWHVSHSPIVACRSQRAHSKCLRTSAAGARTTEGRANSHVLRASNPSPVGAETRGIPLNKTLVR